MTQTDILPSSQVLYDRLQDGLPDLLRRLRNKGYKPGLDQYLSAQTLFCLWRKQPGFSREQIRASLSAVFSTNPDEQQRFHQLFAGWYQDFSDEPPAETTADYSKPPTWAKKISLDKRVRATVVLVTIIILAVVLWPPKSVVTPLEQQPIEQSKPPEPQPIAKTDIPAPRQPDERIIAPESFNPYWAKGLKNLWWAPIIFWVGWLYLQLHHRFLTLSKHKREKNDTIRLETLRLKKGSGELFPRRALAAMLKLWHSYQPFRSRRLHEAATVRLTLQANGYFKPSYKARLLPPEYVLLVDRRHCDDYAAHLAAELRQMLKDEGLFVCPYQYDTDPRYCWPLNRHDRHFSLAQLADRHRGHGLIVIGEAGSFYRMTNGTAIPWGDEQVWRHKTLLTVNSPHDWGSEERQLIKDGFRLEPFTRKGLMRLIEPENTDIEQCLRAAQYQDYRDAPLPVALRAGAWQWLSERKPGRKRQRAVITALKGYLGQQGYYLLSALAAYPALNWQLTLALDEQLGFDGDEERELRLRKLARLPWLRYANLPDVWRRILLNSLKQPMLEKITGAYQALIEYQNENLLELPVAIPDWKSVKQLQNDRINTAKLGDPLQDYVFACVIRGRKPGLLEFTLPHPVKGWFPPEYWRGLAASALQFLVLMLVLSAGVYWAWQQWGNNLLQHQAEQEMHNTLSRYQIKVNYTQPQLQEHAQTLAARLHQWGFNAVVEQQDLAKQSTVTTGVEAINSIEYSTQTPENIPILALQRLSYLTYEAPIKEIQNPQMAESEMVIKLQHIVNPWKGIYFGQYYALIIGINDYRAPLARLKTAVNDAKQVDAMLRQKYGFKTTLLTDDTAIKPTREGIIKALYDLRGKLKNDDNLLIYYAGQGDISYNRYYWLPQDADSKNNSNWISADNIRNLIDNPGMPAKHVLIVVDSCFPTGLITSAITTTPIMTASIIPLFGATQATTSITESKSAPSGTPNLASTSPEAQVRWYKATAENLSRTALTSGGLEPVLDEDSGNGLSIFANAFVEALAKNDYVIGAEQIYLEIRPEVFAKAQKIGGNQMPAYGRIQHTGDNFGEFYFVPRSIKQ